MKSVFVLASAVLLTVCSVSAEVKKSSRNLEPLSKRSGAATASTRSGDTGMNLVAPAREPPKETVTQYSYIGPKQGWGFVQQTSSYYSTQGKHEGTLPGGTLFKYSDVKSSSRNAMLVCTLKRGEAWEGPVLLDCTKVAAYEGDPDKLDPETVNDLGAYFTLKGKIGDRKEVLAEEALAANPYYQTSRQAQKAYQDSILKAAEMEKQLATLTGIRKTKADEALRTLKYEQVQIKAKADKEDRAYAAWKKAHPVDPAKLAADPQLQALEKELEAAHVKVARLVPSK
jgi:hypothetical protein